MKDLAALIKYHKLLRPVLFFFFAAIAFDVGMTMLGLLNPMFTRILFDYAYPYRSLEMLNVAIFAIVATYFLLFFLSIVSDYLQIYVNMEMTAKLTRKVYHAIQCLPLKFHQEKKTGDLMIRITDDVDTVISLVSDVIPTILIEGGRFAIILIIALYMNPFLTVLALLSIPLYILETKFYVRRMQRVEEESIEVGSQIFSHATERLTGIKTIKAFGQEANETLSFGKLIIRSYQVGIKQKLLDIIQAFTNSVTLQMWTMFLTWYLGYQVVQGKLTIGEIVALMMYIGMLGGPIHSFVGLFTSWKVSMISVRRLDEILESPAEDTAAGEDGGELSVADGAIKTDKLTFSYTPDGAEEVLHDLNVKFPKHSLTAIVGSSGSGKTTLANLLIRFFNPAQGVILIDGQNIQEIRVRSLRQHVGMIAQDFSLFDGTVLENILYGSEGKTREDAIKAAKLASAHDFIMRFPKEYDEPVGAGGELLSGGQKQRIAIARTLMRDPEIIVFDEATAALDPESEYHIQEVMTKLARHKTVIAIAHRLSTIKTADKIMVLEEGRFVEEGNFEELIDKKAAFYKFYWRQFGGLSNLRQQLGMEVERSARYGSSFSIALMRLHTYWELADQGDFEGARALMNDAEYLIEKSIRMGDNCAILDEGYIFLLAPEITEEQLEGFLKRLSSVMTGSSELKEKYGVKSDDLFVAATRISKKVFDTPEQLMVAIKEHCDSKKDARGVDITTLTKAEK